MVDSPGHFLIFFGGAMSWTLSFGQLMLKEKTIFNYMFAALLFSAGVCQFYCGLIVTNTITDHLYFAFLHLPFLCATGPAFYFCFKSVIGTEYNFRRRDILHPVSVIIVAIMIIPLVIADDSVKTRVALNPPSFITGDIWRTYCAIIITAIILDVLGYMFFFLKECSFLLDVEYIRAKRVPPLIIIIMAMIYIIGILYFFTFMINNFAVQQGYLYPATLEILSDILFIIIFLMYFMSSRSSNYFQLLRNQAEKSRYEKSKIKNVDLPGILRHLEHLMEVEKVFLNEDICLNMLAGELGIEPYQLSQIINENFNKNFNSFINSYRIDEAKRLLIEEVNRTVFSISYAVGFNSPAPFYEWFQKLTGISPSRFRKNSMAE
ncbi:MAG TPA: helix-turn-helix domain-containing protein [Spirochaetota bacterium]|nr:helix-turn-helix domain-containing protein [Spirochaetota bacterium]